jgi:hypothetical protein
VIAAVHAVKRKQGRTRPRLPTTAADGARDTGSWSRRCRGVTVKGRCPRGLGAEEPGSLIAARQPLGDLCPVGRARCSAGRPSSSAITYHTSSLSVCQSTRGTSRSAWRARRTVRPAAAGSGGCSRRAAGQPQGATVLERGDLAEQLTDQAVDVELLRMGGAAVERVLLLSEQARRWWALVGCLHQQPQLHVGVGRVAQQCSASNTASRAVSCSGFGGGPEASMMVLAEGRTTVDECAQEVSGRVAPASGPVGVRVGPAGRPCHPRTLGRAQRVDGQRAPAQLLATAAPHSSPWLPEDYAQHFRQAARSSVCNAGCARRVRGERAWWITGHSNHTWWHVPTRSVTLRR